MFPPAVPVVARDGLAVATFDLGGPEGAPPLLLAHATGFHGLVWMPLAAGLGDRARRWSLDFPGHGDTPAPPSGETDWRAFARYLLEVVDALGLERPVGVGHSMGGACLLAAELERPGTFAGLHLYEPIVFPDGGPPGASGDGGNVLAAGARRRREVFPDRDAAERNYASKPPLNALRPDALRAYVDHGFEDLPDGTVRLKCRGEQEARTFEAAVRLGAFEQLGAVRCPVVVAAGAHGTGPPAEIAELIADALPHGRVERFDHLGHFGPLESPDELADDVARFVASLGR